MGYVFDYDHVLRLDHKAPLNEVTMVSTLESIQRCGEIMALHIGTVTEVGGRREATSDTAICAFKLYPVNSGEPMKNYKQRSRGIGSGCTGDGRQAISLAGVNPGERW